MARTPWIIAAACAALSGYQFDQRRDLQAQVDDLESQLARAEVQASDAPSTRRERSASAMRPFQQLDAHDAPEGDDGDRAARRGGGAEVTEVGEEWIEEEVEARIQERYDKRRDEWRDRMQSELVVTVDEFAAEVGLSPTKKADLSTLVEGSMTEMTEIWQARRDGEIDHDEAHEEMSAAREDTSDALDELLGEEASEDFKSRMGGPMGHRGGRGGRGQ